MLTKFLLELSFLSATSPLPAPGKSLERESLVFDGLNEPELENDPTNLSSTLVGISAFAFQVDLLL